MNGDGQQDANLLNKEEVALEIDDADLEEPSTIQPSETSATVP